ncbi:MAG: class I SAM-dependent methyltransferase [Marinicella sp.]|nr:class I SAM-dependent methyltransferase [Xanthomonadales bacterium]
MEIIKNNLREEPFLHRKQWEFAMIFRVLHEAGMLNGNSTGIAFGAGKERLIYSVMEKVKKLIATDLYNVNSKWIGTKTNNPKDYLLNRAPFAVDPDRLDAKYMDMREISFPDNSFDFAYSSCVFEHISSDDAGFVEHLNEVKRTLKEGGLYVMTTEYIYDSQTAAIPGSYFFALPHLLDIVKQSGLHLAPVFDARLVEISANEPAPLPSDFSFHFGSKWIPHITCIRQNLTFTSCLLALTKDSSKKPQPPKIIGYDNSMKFVKRTLDRNLNGLWKKWQNVSETRGVSDKPSIVGHENFEVDIKRTNKHLVFHSPYLKFGGGSTLEVKIVLIPDCNEMIEIKLISCEKHEGNHLIIEQTISLNNQSKLGELVKLSCNLKPNRIYAVLGRGKGTFKAINIQMRKK